VSIQQWIVYMLRIYLFIPKLILCAASSTSSSATGYKLFSGFYGHHGWWSLHCFLLSVRFLCRMEFIQRVILKSCVIHSHQLLYPFTYLFTPWSRVLLPKLTGFQLVKKFPAFYGTRIFITAVKSVRHLSLSWARSIQSIPLHSISWRSILILSSHLRLCVVSFYVYNLQHSKFCY